MTLEDLKGRPGILYVAVPYDAHPHGLNSAAYDADRHAGHLIRLDFTVFSPISHSHSMARAAGLDPRDYDLWMKQNAPFMDACFAMVAVHIDGWRESIGMKMEREAFRSMGKPIVEMAALP